jgi:23S rRNA (cytidine1920-2'-O)/16S rRNA (cytidine1409-2'-O)-methyltransferase
MAESGTTRLDTELASRGLARSRNHATSLIEAGLVAVDGRTTIKPSTRVHPAQSLVVAETDHYVSRAAHKLIAALDAFDVLVVGALALDVGASTGGFTQVLLERGAVRVIALDVGHGQLSSVVASDPRVTTLEGINARYLTPEQLAAESRIPERPTVVVGDLSFISLTTVLPALVATAADDADFVLLIKPQFEVGRTGIREGIVKNAALREDAVTSVIWSAWDLGLPTAGLAPSPIVGGHGNLEYLVWLSKTRGQHPTEWLKQITAMTRSVARA